MRACRSSRGTAASPAALPPLCSARVREKERCQQEESELAPINRPSPPSPGEKYITGHLHYGGRQTAGGASSSSPSSSGTLPPPQPPPSVPDDAFSDGGAACSSRRARMAARRDPPFARTSDDFTSALASAACRSAVVPSSAQNGHGASDVFDVEPPPRQPHAAAAAFNAGAVHTRPPVVGSTYCGIRFDTAASWSRARTVSIDMRRRSASFIFRSRRMTGRSGAFDAARTAATVAGCTARRSAGCALRTARIDATRIIQYSGCMRKWGFLFWARK